MQILVQLKLNEEVNNEFEYCELEIPFPNRQVMPRPNIVLRINLVPQRQDCVH